MKGRDGEGCSDAYFKRLRKGGSVTCWTWLSGGGCGGGGRWCW